MCKGDINRHQPKTAKINLGLNHHVLNSRTGWGYRVDGSYVPYKPSYCQFCVKIIKFSLPWQRKNRRLTATNFTHAQTRPL